MLSNIIINMEIIVLFSLLGAVLFIFLLLLIAAIVLVNVLFGRRAEINKKLSYYSVEDFKNMEAKPISFKSNKGQVLRGNIYTNKEVNNHKFVIFFHGFGDGHVSYMKEISLLINKGYTVMSYDNTGCVNSDGDKMIGLPQSLIDAEHALKFFESLVEYKDYPLYLMGHSWGGYTAVNSSIFSKRVDKVVAFSPFNSPSFPSNGNKFSIKILHPFLAIVEFFQFGKYSRITSKKTLTNTSIPIYTISGDEDHMVFRNQAYDIYKKINNPLYKKVLLPNKGHSPQYSIRGEHALKELGKAVKKPDFDNSKFDYGLITEQDKEVWNSVFEFLGDERD